MYAPGVTDQRGALMLQGLLANGQQSSRAASSAAQWLGNFLDQQKQITNAGKSADYFVKANPDALNHMGIHEDEWANLGARDKALAVQGYTQATTAQQIAAENQARTELQLSQANRLNQTTQLTQDESQSLPALMQAFDAMNQSRQGGTVPAPVGLRMPGDNMSLPGLGPQSQGGMPPLPAGISLPGGSGGIDVPAAAPIMTPAVAAMVHAAAQMGPTNPKLAAAIARQVLPALLQTGGTPSSINSQNLPGGYLGFTLPGSREMQIRPPLDALVSGMRDGSIPATPVTGPGGDVLANVIPNQRGGVQVVGKPPAEKQLPEHFFNQYQGPASMPSMGLVSRLDHQQELSTASDEDIKADTTYAGKKPADVRAKAQAQIPILQKKLQDLFALYQKQGYGNADLWDQLYSQHGLQNPNASTPASGGKELTVDQAREFLKQAGGDKAKAKNLAAKAGYTF